MPQAKLLDALKTFNKAHDIMTADILQWSEVPYKEAREFVRSQGLHKMSTTYKWAK